MLALATWLAKVRFSIHIGIHFSMQLSSSASHISLIQK